jgi:uncharacterized protein YndB with AHSA1/START domain
MAKSFGPAGVDIARDSVEIDLRVGGRFDLRMVHGSSGMAYGLNYEIVELVEPELLVLRSEPMPEVGLHQATIARIELHEEDGRTRMTASGAWRQGVGSR